MKRILGSVFGGLVLVTTLWPSAIQAAPNATSPRPALVVPRPLPVAMGWNVPAAGLDWTRLKGKVVLLDFWNVKCKPCVLAMPELVKMRRMNVGKIEIVGVHIGPGTREQIQKIVDEQKLNYPVLAWSETEEAHQWGVGNTVPSLALVDRTGKVRYTDLTVDEGVKKTLELLKE